MPDTPLPPDLHPESLRCIAGAGDELLDFGPLLPLRRHFLGR